LLAGIDMRSWYQVCVVVNFSILKTFQGFGARKSKSLRCTKAKGIRKDAFCFD
jgi:hypothetical protein